MLVSVQYYTNAAAAALRAMSVTAGKINYVKTFSRGVLTMGRTGLQSQTHSSDRPTTISEKITTIFYLKIFIYCMFIRKIIFSFAEQNN